ncbi:MAG: hypothetical protein JW958_02295 [Candidatus Eisenbacteria bacterium]|nr:hypothetical protein [Candidatus Eisenbacteria bacterium]
MKRARAYTVLAACAALLIGAAVARAQSVITHTVSFDPGSVHFEERDGYTVVLVDECVFSIRPGFPMIPARTLHFSLPAGARVAAVEVRALDRIDLGDGFTIRPSQPPARFSDEEPPAFVEPEPMRYASSDPYPERVVEAAGEGNMGGYRVAAVRVNPITLIPGEGRVFLNRSFEIVIQLEDDPEPGRARVPRSAVAEEAVRRKVRALVADPERVEGNGRLVSATKRDDAIDYLIITKPVWTDAFQRLADWKTKKGVRAEVVTTGWVYDNYSGVDSQEQIRNCIKDYEENRGTVWVLLAADDARIPSRIAWDNLGYDQIRCDLYYSDTDGTWNDDGDAYWGEIPSDGVDLYADVYVGRATVHDADEAELFVDKVLTYEGADEGDPLPLDFQEEMLFLAEVLWNPPYSDGGVMKDMIDVQDVPPRFDPITKLYQDDGNLNHSSAMAAMNAGPNITNHTGHCNTNVMSIGPDALYSSDMNALTNGNRQGIFYTIGCWPAAFDLDCIAEHYINNPNGGGVAFVGNSRYGWGCPGYPGECASDLYDRAFFHSIFGEDLYRLGEAHADAKDVYVPESRQDAYMRYCLYELNLLGDPEMPLWTAATTAIDVAHPATLPAASSSFPVTVSAGGAPVDEARVCLWKGEEVYDVGWTGPTGEIVFTPAPATTGTMTITVTGRNLLPYEGIASVESQEVDPDLSTVSASARSMLAPDGNGDSTLTVTVTLRDGSGVPVPGFPAGDVTLLLEGVSAKGTGFHFCASGGDALLLASGDASDSEGRVFFDVIEAGGCGSVTATATAGLLPLTATAVTEVRSPDFNGDGTVNYYDTFQFIPQLQAGTGVCGDLDWSPDGTVDFQDTMKYLPFLSGGASCP